MLVEIFSNECLSRASYFISVAHEYVYTTWNNITKRTIRGFF